MDFFQIAVKAKKDEGLIAYPDWNVGRSEDLMVRAKNFYAIWNQADNLWSTDEYKVQELVDQKLKEFAESNKDVTTVKWMRNFSSQGQTTFRKFMASIGDNAHQLDEKLTFKSDEVKKTDYVSKRLPYDLKEGDYSAWDEMVGMLYAPEQRAKIEWFFGAIISGDSKTIQKFLVLYGPPGAGKGTIIDIAMMLFDGYVTTFDAKALGSGSNQFAASAFATGPLVAIQHDGDLSRIEDNTLLNSIVSKEIMKLNEKYKPAYDARILAALIMGTNKPVKITDSQSGLIRRLIDVHPTGNRLSPKIYHKLKDRIPFQLGAIAYHCLQVYKEMGKNYYSNYQPLEMMFKTNAFYNFIEAHYDLFEKQDGVSAKQAWNLYKNYCEEAGIDKRMSMYAMKSELSTYFDEYLERIVIDGVTIRSYYKGFKIEPFKTPVDGDMKRFMLRLDETTSLLNLELAEMPAQYAKADGSPSKYWDDSERLIGGVFKRPRPNQIVDTLLRDIDPYREHYVKVPENLIVADFDITDENGNKSLELNLEAASDFPPTYAEISRSGEAVHLHYYWDGDVTQLESKYLPGIEIKVYPGNSALRRRLTRCNNVPIATISTGLPLKEKKRVLDVKQIQSVQGLRRQIDKALNKEINAGTKSNVDYIRMIVNEYYESGREYDISDLKSKITAFASRSSNQPIAALKAVAEIRWKSEDDEIPKEPEPEDPRVVIYDVEVYPNLFVVCWTFVEEGVEPKKENVVRMINPKPHEVQSLFNFKLVGFYNRHYDNHILWAAALGFDNEKLFRLSQKLVDKATGAKFGDAYKISHSDILDFSTKKQSLKKWQIDLGLEHREIDLPWDQPVPEDRIMDVVEYCVNDVVSTVHVFTHLSGDWKARKLLSELSGLSPNDTTPNQAAKIIFGNEKNPQRAFVYTDLSKEFPGYVFEGGKSTYRGVLVGEGGLVDGTPGIYEDVALLDVASMHPTSIGKLNLFGEFTPRYMEVVQAQLALKHKDFDTAYGLLEGKLRPYIEDIERLLETDPDEGKRALADLRQSLKIAANIVYGLTSAKFDNPFMDRRNVDNIVAKRGALFMVDLKNFIIEKGFNPIHIKTDSVKIANATQEIIDDVIEFAAKYGYAMEYNPATDQYSKLALLNDAVYVAKKDDCVSNCWTATGTQFLPEANPYVFKKLFGQEDDIYFDDLCVTKQVQQGKLYLDFGNYEHEELVDGYVNWAVDETKRLKKAGASEEEQAVPMQTAIDNLIFVGKIGRFTPVKPGFGGGQLWRIKDGKAYAAPGTKGRLWVDANIAMDLPGDAIDYGYFEDLVTEARADLEKLLDGSGFNTVDEFLS